MKHFQIGREGLGKLYKALAEDALDRIVGDRLSLPSPHHDRINMAHARMCALVSQNGHLPSRNRALQLMQAAGLGTDEIMDVIQTMEVYADHPVITDGKLAVHLQHLGVPVTAENLT